MNTPEHEEVKSKIESVMAGNENLQRSFNTIKEEQAKAVAGQAHNLAGALDAHQKALDAFHKEVSEAQAGHAYLANKPMRPDVAGENPADPTVTPAVV